jgi:uncharacterized Zn finger protein (UPF0148 family)
MSISLRSVQCPECGASLPIEEGRKQVFCSYCGTPVIITNENEHIYHHIDDAEIKHAETEQIIRLKELELETLENEKKRKALMIAYGIALIFVIAGFIIYSVSPMGGLGAIEIGALIGLFTFLSQMNKHEKKQVVVGEDEVMITAPMTNCSEKDYNHAILLFKDAGFTNVKAVPLHDLNILTRRKQGLVETVTINGSEDFHINDVFSKKVNILISYHSK